MPPARTTVPIPAFSHGLSKDAKVTPVCQDTAPPHVTPESAILLIEQKTAATEAFRLALQTATGWRAMHAESADEALRAGSILRNRLKIVLITTGRNCDPVLRLIHDLKELAVVNRIDCPSILILSLVSQRPQMAIGLERLGAEYLLRRYSEPIVEMVRKIQWRLSSNKSLPTIVIRRHAGHVAEIVIRNGLAESELKVGPKLRKLVEYFALHARIEHTTQMIADALGVCRQSVKEYLHRLRQACDRANEGKAISLSGERLFWTKKILGGYVHGVSASFEIADEDDF